MTTKTGTGTVDRPGDLEVRWNWLKAMYAANVLIAGPLGLATLLAPGFVRELFAIPAGEPISMGVGMGAIPLAFGLAGLVGLRAPLRLTPVLALQACYKSLFLLGVIVPLAVMGGVPGYALPIVGIFIFFIVGDLIAIPWNYLRSPAASPGVADTA